MVEFLHSRGSMESMVNPWSVCWRLYLDHTENIFKILVFINVLIMHKTPTNCFCAVKLELRHVSLLMTFYPLQSVYPSLPLQTFFFFFFSFFIYIYRYALFDV